MHHVLVVEPHLLMRKGIAALVDQLPQHRVVAEVVELESALQETLSWRPSLVVVGWDGQRDDLGEVLTALRSLPQAPCVLVLVPPEQLLAGAREALTAGCEGVAPKNLTRESFERALLDLAHGRAHVDPQISRLMVLSGPDALRRASPVASLTAREQEVFRLIAAGHTNRSAGEVLHISPKTVEKHRALVMQKLRLRHALDLMLLARDLGMVTTDTPHSGPMPLDD